MKSSSSSKNSSSSNSNTVVDKENTGISSMLTVNLHPRQRAKQKYAQEQEESLVTESVEVKVEKVSNQMTLSARIDMIQQKLTKLHSLKDETLAEFSSILNELNELVPIINQWNPIPVEEEDSFDISNEKISGLSKLLHRLQHLQQEYQKRRSVSDKRLNFKIFAIKERFNAEMIHNKTELESEIAETSVALIHRQMSKLQNSKSIIDGSSSSLANTGSNGSTISLISARKRSLPAINQPIGSCPPVMKIARRQSVAAYPNQNIAHPSTNNAYRESTNSSILNFNSVTSSKSVADTDLLAIKSRISNALKR